MSRQVVHYKFLIKPDSGSGPVRWEEIEGDHSLELVGNTRTWALSTWGSADVEITGLPLMQQSAAKPAEQSAAPIAAERHAEGKLNGALVGTAPKASADVATSPASRGGCCCFMFCKKKPK